MLIIGTAVVQNYNETGMQRDQKIMSAGDDDNDNDTWGEAGESDEIQESAKRITQKANKENRDCRYDSRGRPRIEF